MMKKKCVYWNQVHEGNSISNLAIVANHSKWNVISDVLSSIIQFYDYYNKSQFLQWNLLKYAKINQNVLSDYT